MGTDAVALEDGDLASRSDGRGMWMYCCRHTLGGVVAEVGFGVVAILPWMFRDPGTSVDVVVVLLETSLGWMDFSSVISAAKLHCQMSMLFCYCGSALRICNWKGKYLQRLSGFCFSNCSRDPVLAARYR